MLTDNTIIAIALAILALAVFGNWYQKRTKRNKQINCIPGIKTYPLVGTTHMFFGKNRNDIFDTLREEAAQFPYISRVWIGPFPEVCIRKAEYVEKIISSTKNLEKSFAYKFIRFWLGEGLLVSGGEKWQKHRKIITPTFHFSILETFFEVFSEQSNILVEQLNDHCGTAVSFDIYTYINRVALDIICSAAMGVSIQAQGKGNNEYVDAVYEVSELIMKRIVRPWLHPSFIYKLTGDGKKFYNCLTTLHGYSNNVIQLRKIYREREQETEDSLKKKRLAFLDLLLEANETDNLLTDQEIREEVDTFMFEGHDTTTSGIAWTIFLLGLHSEIQAKVHSELNSIFHGSDRRVTLTDMSEMKYLERVIKESMRLYPPVPIIGRVLGEDVRIEEFVIPKGCMIKIDIFNLHRDPRFFVDPEKFDPDRFLPEYKNRHPYAYIPFSAGPRNCIGQRFASYEQKTVLSAILRKFKVQTVDKRDDVKMINELTLRPIGGINVILEKR